MCECRVEVEWDTNKLPQITYCDLHANAGKLRQQVRTSAYKLHSAAGHNLTFDECKREDCIAARAVLAEAKED